VFRSVVGDAPTESATGYTLAQKIVGRACGLPNGKGVLPNIYCEPAMTTVGSQDTTGPMTRCVLLHCVNFSSCFYTMKRWFERRL
jgi:aconitate hydratase 2/2-methylisocitrate dehydratase